MVRRHSALTALTLLLWLGVLLHLPPCAFQVHRAPHLHKAPRRPTRGSLGRGFPVARAAEKGPSSFDDSPDWVKAIVSGLTAVVNSLGGSGEGEARARRARAFERITPEALLEGIRSDFEDRKYLWSGDIDAELYDEACTFTDPTLSFQGLDTFEKNIRNLRPILDSLIPDQDRRCILRDLRQTPEGQVTAKWTMIGDLRLPWSPRIELSGQTTYTPGSEGRIVSYDEKWNISAGEALGQILTPGPGPSSEAPEHWPGQSDGAPPPAPRASLARAPPFVLLPGFGNDAEDYVAPLGQAEEVGLQACLRRRGCRSLVSPVWRPEWLLVFLFGLLDEDFRAGNGTAAVAFGWYLDKAKRLVEETTRSTGTSVVLLGHSAGGWLARALLQREGKSWLRQHVLGLVTLGTPHVPPPEGVFDMTMGCLRNLNDAHPGAFHKDAMFYFTVAGDAITGAPMEGNVPIMELVQSPSPESTAFNSYKAVCGDGFVTGDGVVPLAAAHLDGAKQLTIKGCLHSINVVGTVRPTTESYLCERFVDAWLRPLAEEEALAAEPAGAPAAAGPAGAAAAAAAAA